VIRVILYHGWSRNGERFVKKKTETVLYCSFFVSRRSWVSKTPPKA